MHLLYQHLPEMQCIPGRHDHVPSAIGLFLMVHILLSSLLTFRILHTTVHKPFFYIGFYILTVTEADVSFSDAVESAPQTANENIIKPAMNVAIFFFIHPSPFKQMNY